VEETKTMDKREELELRTKEKRKKLTMILAAAIVVVAAAGLFFMLRTKRFENYKELASTELYSNVIGYDAKGDTFYAYSNDGAKGLTAEGKVRWEMSYHLDNPELSYCNNVASVADIGGTSVYVVAENGIPYHYEVMYPIVKHAVAKQGVTAVLLDNGTEDFIQLYDINGTLRVDINTKTKLDGIPVDIALSEDGKRLVTLYVTFQGSEIIGKVTFYNAGEVGKNYLGNVVGQKTFERNVLVYDVGFLNKDYVYVLYENGFSVYHMKEVPELVQECNIKNEILDVAVTEDGIYFVEKTSLGEKRLSFYSVGDGLIAEWRSETWKNVPEYEKFMATKDEVIFFSPQSVLIYRKNKSLKYKGEFRGTQEALFPIGGNKYFLVDSHGVRTIKLSGKKQNEGE